MDVAAGVSMFEQAILPVENEATFAEVRLALEQAFAPNNIEDLLHRMKRAGLRARDFESVLAEGLVGKSAPGLYAALGNSDQGQVRELYLRLVEQVPQELRARYLKLYSYY